MFRIKVLKFLKRILKARAQKPMNIRGYSKDNTHDKKIGTKK